MALFARASEQDKLASVGYKTEKQRHMKFGCRWAGRTKELEGGKYDQNTLHEIVKELLKIIKNNNKKISPKVKRFQFNIILHTSQIQVTKIEYNNHLLK